MQAGDLAFFNQGWVYSIELAMAHGNFLVRGAMTIEGKHAGLAETCEIVRAALEAQIPGVRAASSLSTTDRRTLLRWSHRLDLENDPASAARLPCLSLRRRVTTGEHSRGASLRKAQASPHEPQRKAAWQRSGPANTFFLLKLSTIEWPFLRRSGAPPPSRATRFLVCSYEPADVVGLRRS